MFLPRLEGLFSVMKPKNMTSAEVCNRIRVDLLTELGFPKFSQSDLKIGHGGTLDRDATGVMAIGIGIGCKYLTKMLHSKKRYICKGEFGRETNTCYPSGTLINSMPFDHVTHEMLIRNLTSFVGEIQQVPPKYSALKFKGRRISDMAYAGETVPDCKLVPRSITVHDITCLEFNLPHFILDIKCGSGCYVRSIVRDLGNVLGTCSLVCDLERIEHGPFNVQCSIPSFEWTIDNVIRAVEDFKNSNKNMSQLTDARFEKSHKES